MKDKEYPFAHEVTDLKEGDIVYWDDRLGWEGIVAALPTPDTLDVDYANGEQDREIDRRLFTVKR